MRIVIEVDGEKITAIGPDTAPAASTEAAAAAYGDPLPGPAPRELLQRAKKLGARSAGAAQFARGAALASSTPVSLEPTPSAEPRKRNAATRARRPTKTRARRSR
jgi:hypothetical protein